MSINNSIKLTILSTALLFTTSATFAMVDPWEEALTKGTSRAQLSQMCMDGMKKTAAKTPPEVKEKWELWGKRFKALQQHEESETLTGDEVDSLRKLILSRGGTPPTEPEEKNTLGNLGLPSVETPSFETEEDRLKRTIKEQEEKIRLLELENTAKENQGRLEELEKEKSAPIPTATAPVVAEHLEKVSEIKRIRALVNNKPEKETDPLARGVQKLGNHYDRTAEKKHNKSFWGIREDHRHILKLFNEGKLDMVSPPAYHSNKKG